MTKPIVLISAPCPRSGKDTIAEYLRYHYNYAVVSYNEPLYAMARVLYADAGINNERIASYFDINKEELVPEFGQTTRYILKKLGTEWGREMIKRDLWIDIAMNKIRNLIPQETVKGVAIPSCRFREEIDTPMALFYDVKHWRVSVPNKDYEHDGHPSEGALDNDPFDEILTNEWGSFDPLYQQIHDIMQKSPYKQYKPHPHA